jgi:hypothetical protein
MIAVIIKKSYKYFVSGRKRSQHVIRKLPLRLIKHHAMKTNRGEQIELLHAPVTYPPRQS